MQEKNEVPAVSVHALGEMVNGRLFRSILAIAITSPRLSPSLGAGSGIRIADDT